MPYVGRDLQRGNYLKLDDIAASFNGSTTTFNLTSGGNAFFPGSAFSIIVSLGGVVQEPESAYQIDRSQIIFAQAPPASSDFFCIALGVALGVGVPGHGTVGNDHLAKPLTYADYFKWDSANNRVGINTLLPSTALDVVGDATFSGAVSIGGTLTYEDVANIDAVGIITAQAGIEDKTLTAGRVVYAGTGGRLVDNSGLTFNPTTLNIPGLNVTGVSTFSNDITLNGANFDITYDRSVNTVNFDQSFLKFGTSGQLVLRSSGSFSTIDSTAGLVMTVSSLEVKQTSGDKMIKTYNNGAVELYHDDHLSFTTNTNGITLKAPDGGDCVLDMNADRGDDNPDKWRINVTQGGSFQLKNYADGSWENHIQSTVNSSVQLYNNGNVKLETKGYGIDITGGFITTGGSIVNDGGNIKFGTHSDLQIFHDNSNNINVIQCHNGRTLHIDKDNGSENMAKFIPDGAVELYHGMGGSTGSSKKFETTSTGIEVTGEIQRSGWNNNVTLIKQQYSATGNYYQAITADAASRALRLDSNSADNSAKIEFRTGSNGTLSKKLEISHEGHILPATAGAVNIGSATAEIGDVFLADDKSVQVGNSQDLKIFHDSSATNNVIEGHTGSLNLRNYNVNSTNIVLSARNHIILQTNLNETAIQCLANGATEIFHDGGATPKLRTSTKGIQVLGEVVASQDYPDFRPKLDLNFAAKKKLDPIIHYTRTGAASHYTELGLLKIVGDNEPRFDHNPTTGESLGLLFEESRTNNKTYSQDFSTGWNISGVVDYRGNNDTSIETPEGITDGVGVMPLIEGSGGSAHQFYSASTTQVTKYITYSVFAKPNGRNHIQHQDGPFVHDLVNGTTSGSATGEYVSATTTKLANGWCRCTMTRNHNNSYDQFNLKLHNGSSASYSGDGSSGVYIWGVQQEDAGHATSYIPTNGTTVTRGRDIANIDGEELTDFYNPDESTIVVDYTHLKGATVTTMGTNSRVYRFRATSGADTRIDYVSTAAFHPYIAKDGGAVASLSHGSNPVLDGGVNRSAVRVKKDSFGVSCNGSAVSGNALDTSGAWPPTNPINELNLGGNTSSGGMLIGHLRRFMYYPVGLPNSQLVTLSS